MNPAYIYMNMIAPAFNILPVIVGLANYKRESTEGKMLLYYLVFNCIISATSSLLAYRHLTNIPLFHFSTVIETLILLFFFSGIFYKKPINTYLKILMVIFPCFCVLNTLLIQNIFTFNSYALSLQSFIIIALCFLYWWHNENDKEKTWASFPLNWIISGLLLYFASAFILFTFSNFGVFYFSRRTFILIWNIHATLTIIMYVLISIGYSKYKTQNG